MLKSSSARLRGYLMSVVLSTALIGAVEAGEYNITVDPVEIDTGTFTRTGI